MRCKRILSMLLAVLIVFFSFSAAFAVSANAEDEGGKAIYVVYDNSGSMYYDFSKNKTIDSWCKAKYAMEVFASMMDYDKDLLKIYTMHKVKIGSSECSDFEVKSTDDIDKIHTMLTKSAQGTPFSTVKKAYADLQNDSHDEKWLVVLTDGKLEIKEGTKVKQSALEKQLNEYKASGVGVAYFAFGKKEDIIVPRGKFISKSAEDAKDTTEKLIEICNSIFKRDEAQMSGDKVSFDVSMKKIIVFAQGKGASIQSVNGAKSVKMVDGSLRKAQYSPKEYSAEKADKKSFNLKSEANAPKVDKSLAGVIATFGDKDILAGTYTINAKGSVNVYYEPDVRVGISLKDEKGKEVDTKKGKLDEGEYTVNYSLYDAQTNQPIEHSDLLGNIDYKATYTAGGKEQPLANGDKIKFTADMNELAFQVVAEYGPNKDNRHKAFNTDADSGFKFKVNGKKDSLKIKLKASQIYYVIKKLDQSKEIIAEVSLDGQPLSDEQLNQMKPSVTLNLAVDYDIKPLPGQSAYAIKLKAKDGDIKKTGTGILKCTCSGAIKDKLGVVRTAEDSCLVTLSTVEEWVPVAIILASIALLILLLIWWLNQKVLPKRWKIVESSMIIGRNEVTGSANLQSSGGSKKNGRITVKSPSFEGVQTGATFNLKAIDPRRVKSAKRKALVTGVSAIGAGVDSVSISALEYARGKSGKFVLDGDDDAANAEKRIPYSYEVVVSGKFETDSGRKKNVVFTAKVKHL